MSESVDIYVKVPVHCSFYLESVNSKLIFPLYSGMAS
jgi:hypothetical protein